MKYFLLLLFYTGSLCAQNRTRRDTVYYQKFSSDLIVGVFQAYRSFNNEFRQFIVPDSNNLSTHRYIAESKLVTGIEVNYDKFGFSLGIRSAPQANSQGKGNTTTLNGSFNFGGNRWLLENSARLFRGFYDNTPYAYDSLTRSRGDYLHQPSFSNTLLRSKFLYFTNHRRYAFRSAYACNYRQRRSGGTWIFGAGITYNNLQNDSSFFPAPSKPYYQGYSEMNHLGVLAVSLNAGGAFSLVLWRAFFIHAMFIVGPEQQWRNYGYLDRPSQRLSYISLSGDLRSSIGFNFERLYIISYSLNGFAVYNSSAVGLTSSSLGGGLILGWRFHSRTPEFYKKFQASRLYSFF